MGTKHMQSNSTMVGRVSKSHKMLCKAVDKHSKELQQPSPKSLATASSKKLDSTASTRVACCRSLKICTCESCMEYGQHNEISLKLVQKNEAVVEPFSSKKFVGVADKQCKQLLEALGIFNSNKELFVNLLQDPNSLLIKRIEDSTDSRNRKQQTMTFFDSTMSENKLREVGEYEEPDYGQSLKPCGRLPAEDSDDSLSLERIVVLKPNPTSSLQEAVGSDYCSSLKSHSSFIKNGQSDKRTLFSFRQIKRKMKQAMGVRKKEGEYLSTNGMPEKIPPVCRLPKDDVKQMVMEESGKSYSNIQTDARGIFGSCQDSLERDQLEKAFYSRNGDKTASTSEISDKKIGQSAVIGNLKRQKSKKHEGDKDVSRKMKAKPWGWMMCFSDDDILPSNKPGCHTANRMRYSHLSNKKFIHEKKTKLQNDEEQNCKTPQMIKLAEERRDDDQLNASTRELNVSPVAFSDVKVDQDPIIEGSVKIVKDIATIHQVRDDFCEASSRLDNNCNANYCPRTNKIKGIGEKGNPELSRQNLPLEVQPTAFSVDTFPSSSLQFQIVECPNGLCDGEVQPLPDTINNQLLGDANSRNLAFTSRTAEPSGEALPINFEEDQCRGLARLQELLDPAIVSFCCCGSISRCVLELLQVTKQNWNELSLATWLQISVVDKVKMFSSHLCGDCVLLFNYFNEVLDDVFHCYIRRSPWLSSYTAHIQAPDKESAFYHEVMQHVDWPLLQQQQQQSPQTLDCLCLRDLKSRTWINCPTETEEIVTVIAESVLRELVIESVVYLGL